MLAQRMFEWVSTALRQYIVDNYEIDQAYVDEILKSAILDEILSEKPTGNSRRAPGKITEALEKEGGVTPEFMVDALRDGEVRLFIQIFHQITGLGESLIMEMLYEFDGKGLAIACKAAGLGKVIFHSLFTLSRKARQKGQETLRQDLRKALTLYDKMSEDAAAKVVDLWKGDVDYTAAIRELELS